MNEASGRQAVPHSAAIPRDAFERRYDVVLIVVVAGILALGLVMVASASTSIAARVYGDPLALFWRQSFHVVVAVGVLVLCTRTPVRFWERIGPHLMIASVALLAIVLLPGVGREVNGAIRWLTVGGLNLQPSEPAKLFFVVYLAGHLARIYHPLAVAQTDRTVSGTSNPARVFDAPSDASVRRDSRGPRGHHRLRALLARLGEACGLVRGAHGVSGRPTGIVGPIAVLALVAGLLKLEPDHGAIFVLCAAALGMLFLAGVSIVKFAAWTGAGAALMTAAALTSTHVVQRLTSFLDPFADPYGSGFQLVQALIAIGRGGWFGVGLGEGVQKLFYLPEAHTDFLFAVLAEEFGFLGMVATVALFTFLVLRALAIGRFADDRGSRFAAYAAYGIGLLLALNAFINIGVNIGLLPTKGLVLPLMSYGGSSLVVSAASIGILIRIDHECRTESAREAP